MQLCYFQHKKNDWISLSQSNTINSKRLRSQHLWNHENEQSIDSLNTVQHRKNQDSRIMNGYNNHCWSQYQYKSIKYEWIEREREWTREREKWVFDCLNRLFIWSRRIQIVIWYWLNWENDIEVNGIESENDDEWMSVESFRITIWG